MSLNDRTNETIPLAIELPAGAELCLDIDSDSHVWPEPWVWLEVNPGDPDRESHAWRLTIDEVEQARDRLNLILGAVGRA